MGQMRPRIQSSSQARSWASSAACQASMYRLVVGWGMGGSVRAVLIATTVHQDLRFVPRAHSGSAGEAARVAVGLLASRPSDGGQARGLLLGGSGGGQPVQLPHRVAVLVLVLPVGVG
jgi:hypothetical protein